MWQCIHMTRHAVTHHAVAQFVGAYVIRYDILTGDGLGRMGKNAILLYSILAELCTWRGDVKVNPYVPAGSRQRLLLGTRYSCRLSSP